MRKIGVMMPSSLSIQEGPLRAGRWIARVVLLVVLFSGLVSGLGASSEEKDTSPIRERFKRVRSVKPVA